jgi:putative glutamine transport system substrate-binding protein
MKKCLFILIFSVVFLTGCAELTPENPVLERIKLRNEIIVGVKADSPPFGFIEDDEFKGLDIDIARHIAKSLLGDENAVAFVPATAQNRISLLNARKVDMIIATMSINPSRMRIVDFTLPYHEAGQALMVPRRSEIRSMLDLRNKNVAIVLGTTAEHVLRQNAPSASIVGNTNYTDAFEKLKDGEVQAILADDSILLGLIAGNRGYKILPRRYTKEYYAIATEKSPNAEFRNVLNSIIRQMQEDGELRKIQTKWLPKGVMR